MSKEDWEDLLWDLTNNDLSNEEKSEQRYRLAAHMAKLEDELTSLRRRVANLEKDLNE